MRSSARCCRIHSASAAPTPRWCSSGWMPKVSHRGGGVVAMQDLMKGKRGLIMGIANDHSIAWGIARTLAAHGAEMAFTYQGDALGKRVKPLAQSLKAELVLPCDVENIASVDEVFATLKQKWGSLDFVVHAIG